MGTMRKARSEGYDNGTIRTHLNCWTVGHTDGYLKSGKILEILEEGLEGSAYHHSYPNSGATKSSMLTGRHCHSACLPVPRLHRAKGVTAYTLRYQDYSSHYAD